MAKAFEKSNCQLYDVPKIRDKVVNKLKSIENSPLGDNDDYMDGYEKKFLEALGEGSNKIVDKNELLCFF